MGFILKILIFIILNILFINVFKISNGKNIFFGVFDLKLIVENIKCIIKIKIIILKIYLWFVSFLIKLCLFFRILGIIILRILVIINGINSFLKVLILGIFLYKDCIYRVN